MANKDREKYNEYMRLYVLRRYHRRRAEAIKRLGGKCEGCGTLDGLQLDHVNPETKSIDLGKLWSVSEQRFWAEITKCQLLCQPCHTLKTIKDLGLNNAKLMHGTVSSYRYCKCDLCRSAWNKLCRKYKARHRAKQRARGEVV